MTKILISAGEVSGDLHAASVTKAIKELEPSAEVFGMGGDALRAAGGEVLFDIKDHGVMGFVEVVKKLPAIYKLRSDFAKVMDERKPDCLLIVDYPGFNMRLAKVAQEKNIPVVSYIAPSAWAWHKSRAKTMAKLATKIASIFPFEYDVYKEAGADIEFVGHPLIDIVKPSMSKEAACEKFGKKSGDILILLLPGSRKMEIERLLPTILQGAKLIQAKIPNVKFIMPRASSISKEVLEAKIKEVGIEVKITEGDNYDVMSIADLALATSGTVTLEAALCGLGSVILYKSSAISFTIAKHVVNIPNIGLPNIVAGRKILPELLQDDCTPEVIAKEAVQLLQKDCFAKMQEDLKEVKAKLGEAGAVKRVAELVLRVANNK